MFSFPTDDKRFIIPENLIHGTTEIGIASIREHGIKSRGYSPKGVPNFPKSLDFGGGFYCSYSDKICIEQVKRLTRDRAEFYKSKPIIINVNVNPQINQDNSLKCIYFDGRYERINKLFSTPYGGTFAPEEIAEVLVGEYINVISKYSSEAAASSL